MNFGIRAKIFLLSAVLVTLALTINGIAAIVIAFVLTLVCSQYVSKRLSRLTDAALRMASGDLDARVRIRGGDEFAKLGSAMDRLAESLSVSIQDLKREKVLLNGVLSGMQEGVLLLDREHRIVLFNPALKDMFLLGPDVIERSIFEVVRYVELSELIHRLGANQPQTPTDSLIEQIDVGGLKPRKLLVQATRFTREPGGILAVFMDITEMSRLEALRRDFVANVSHELRTPVTVLRSATETLHEMIGKGPSDVIQFVEMIDRNVVRMHNLVENLLDLSRIESQEYKLQSEDVDLCNSAAMVISQFQSAAKRKKIYLSSELKPGECRAKADSKALEQVWGNLIDNAIKYCDSGAHITFKFENGNERGISIAVEDTGPGIEEKHLSRLFERFYRVDPGRSRETGGTGLGLSIVKHLVQAMKGSVNVTSAVGKGTKFIISLPGAYIPLT